MICALGPSKLSITLTVVTVVEICLGDCSGAPEKNSVFLLSLTPKVITNVCKSLTKIKCSLIAPVVEQSRNFQNFYVPSS